MEILQNLEPLLRTFWYIAIPVSLFFIIQTVMTFVGGGDMGDISVDMDADAGFGDSLGDLFSLRSLVNFLIGFSWGGIALYTSIANKTLLIVLCVLIGIAFVILFYIILRQLLRLSHDGSFKMDEALNKTAEVYLTIPANRNGKGKVLVSVGGSVRELDAMTEDVDSLHNTASVKVVKIENNNILIVEKI
ncbi:MAG: serine protease [Bacteroidia bacterium]|nr:serine protease [Bacteroidia bacterium]